MLKTFSTAFLWLGFILGSFSFFYSLIGTTLLVT